MRDKIILKCCKPKMLYKKRCLRMGLIEQLKIVLTIDLLHSKNKFLSAKHSSETPGSLVIKHCFGVFFLCQTKP